MVMYSARSQISKRDRVQSLEEVPYLPDHQRRFRLYRGVYLGSSKAIRERAYEAC